MPIQMVCDSTPSSLVSAAIRDALHSSASNGRLSSSSSSSGANYGGVTGTANGSGSNSGGTGLSSNQSNKQQQQQQQRRSLLYDDIDDEHNDCAEEGENDLVEAISQSLRQGQQLKPLQYVPGPSYSNSLDKLKSKYIVLRATTGGDATSSPGNQQNSSTGNAAASPMHLSKGASTNSSSTSGGTSIVTMNGSAKFSSSAGKMASSNVQNGIGTGVPGSGSGKDNTLPTPKRTLFPRENVQTGWKTTGRKWQVGAGMINMGNTCYLNSTLQALFHVPAIANWLISDVQHRERCDDGGSGGSCIICAMAKTLLESQANQSAIKPYLVYSKLRLVCKHLVPGRQEDAHEFLRYLVEAMEKSYLGRYKNSKELDQYSKETTPLNQILGGYLRSEVKCLSCQHVSTTFQHFEDLLLDIRKAGTIDEALELYFAREMLEEMGYKCEACKHRVPATKQFSLERAPFALCVQLKRFSMMGTKINKHVELRSRLDLTPYSSPALKGSNGKLIYRLTSMVTHLGSTQHCGHYTAIGHTDASGYHVFDDSSVRPIGMHNVTSTNAYILFYELESSASSAAATLPTNGVCRTKPTATVGQPSSTATLTSMGHLGLGSDGNAAGPGTGHHGTGGAAGGSSGTPGKASIINSSSPLRVLGTAAGGGGNGATGGLFPSKLEQKCGFIGPVLPPTAASAASQSNTTTSAGVTLTSSSGAVATAGQTGGAGTIASFIAAAAAAEANGSGKDVLSSPSSSPSTLSNASPLQSPVKQQPVPSAQFSPKTSKLPSSSGAAAAQKSNGLAKEESRKNPSTATLLPSMPKLQALAPSNNAAAASRLGSSANGVSKSTNSVGSSSIVSLVPYETDDDSDGSSSDDDEEQATKKATVAKRPTKQAVYNGAAKPSKIANDESDEEEGDQQRDEEGAADERQEMAASRSPQIIKTKTGIWKVSKSSTADQLSFPDSSSSGSSTAGSQASSPANSGGSSPSSSPSTLQQQHQEQQQQHQNEQQSPPHARNGDADGGTQQLSNGGGYRNGTTAHYQQFNGAAEKRKPVTTTNGYHHQGPSNGVGGGGDKARTTGSSSTVEGPGAVQMLLKLSHRGYGAPVKSWDGQETAMDRELAIERREERKRQIEDDRETEMDRGRTKKSKAGGGGGGGGCGGAGANSSVNGNGNVFQQYQNYSNGNGSSAKWNGSGGNRNHYGNHHHHQAGNYRAGFYPNGSGHRHHGGGGGQGNGFRNNGRRFGGRHGGGGGGGGGFHSKAYHHHQRNESSGGGGGGMASSGGGNSGSNGFYHR